MDRFERVVELAGKYKADLEERLVALRGDSSAIESTMDVFSSICDWRYSRGVFYTPLYFFNELVGDSPGKVVKKKFPSPLDARYEGFECAGFLGGDLAITISSAKGAENSRLVASRIERDGKKVFVLTSCHYDFTSLAGRAPEVVSVSLIDGIASLINISSILQLFLLPFSNICLALSLSKISILFNVYLTASLS